MSRGTDRQFREADAAIECAVHTLMTSIEKMMGQWGDVAPTYIVQVTLLELCKELPKLIDAPDLAEHVLGPAELKLSNALTDYRDTREQERGA